ncbi:toprim domain-containing protein [Bacillus sp. 7894-2]|uniref:toprim domain-containing protein n=1 Tax=Bacillus sp. 7894-2 TaxID=2021695 RepID=UPI000BA67A62|nr:toprim domain-containing protein [Bacillus sp. 7894-2]PAE24020.1 hypothetical protein CHI10_14540 [Bacillus sp. 7894-2]
MNKVSIDGHLLNMDIIELLTNFTWHRATWKSDRLIAASPFRDEHHPSFFVFYENGAWGDSGAFDENYASGNLAKLLAFLRNETYDETIEYLCNTYGVRDLRPGERIEVPSVSLRTQRSRIVLEEKYLEPYRYRNPYLRGRGITEQIQRFAGIGYCRDSKAITIPWRHADGSLANTKFRTINGKLFWYVQGGAPIGTLVYGIDKAYARNWKTVVACEAEIDALSWLSCGVPAIALGGTAVTREQIDIIRRSPIERIIKAEDNDGPGAKMGRLLRAGLRGYMAVESVKIPDPYNDSNEAYVKGVNLRQLVEPRLLAR